MTDPAAHEARRPWEEWAQMCDAPSDAFSAGEWCEAANDLLVHLAASRAQLEQMRALVEQAEFGMTLREDVLTPEERIAREAQRNLLALFKDALAAIPDPEAVSRG